MKRKFILLAMMLLTLIGGVKFNVLNAQETVTIGSIDPNYRNNFLPFCTYNYVAISQQIYTSDQIGQSGTINAISFHRFSGGISYARLIDIYMINTSKDSFAGTTDWVSLSDSDKVYSGDLAESSGEGLITFVLNTPFEYTGENLLICINVRYNGQWTNDNYFAVFNTDETRALYNASDNSSSYNPSNMSGGSALNKLNYIELNITPAVTDDIIPAAPTNLQAEIVDHQSINLTWDVAENALKYQVWQRDEGMIAEIEETEFLVEGLSDYTGYCFTVKSVRYNNTSDASDEVCAVTAVLPVPETPVNLAATNITHNSVTLTWDAVEYAESYTVSYTGGTTITVTENTCDVTGLTPETDYTFSVTANNIKGSSSAAEVSATTLEYSDPFAGKFFRVKVNDGYYAGRYLTVNNYYGSGGTSTVGVAYYQESSMQVFTIEDNGLGQYYLKSGDGYYLVCEIGASWWGVHANSTTSKTPLEFEYTDNDKFYIKDYNKMTGNSQTGNDGDGYYFKVEKPNNSTSVLVYCDAPSYYTNTTTSYITTWSVEEVPFSAAAAAYNSTIFDDETTTLSVTTVAGSGNYTYSWSPANGLSDATGANPTFTPATTGEHTFTCTVTDTESGSTAEASVTVYVNARPALQLTISADKGLIYNDDETAVLTATVTEGTGYAPYTYSWTLNGEAIEGATEATYTFSNTTVGEYTLTCTVTDARNNTQTASTTIEVKYASEKPLEIEIGSNEFGQNYIPLNSYYYAAFSQQIYTSDQIGQSGCIINDISFYRTENIGLNDRNIEIYLLNTDKSKFDNNNDWVKLSENDKVYANSSYTNDGLGWFTFTLDTPFEYTGGNLLVCMHVIKKGYNYTLYDKYAAFNTENSRALYRANDSDTYNISNITQTGTLLNQLNHIKFGYEIPAPKPESLVATPAQIHVGETTTLTWNELEGAVSYNIYVDGVLNGNTEKLTCELSDLTYNVEPGHTIEVAAVYADATESGKASVTVQVAGTFTLTVNVTDGTDPIEGATVEIDMTYAYDEFFKKLEMEVESSVTDEFGVANVSLPLLAKYYDEYDGMWITPRYNVKASKVPYSDANVDVYCTYISNLQTVERTLVLTLPMVDYIQVQDEEGNDLNGDVMEGTNVVLSWDAVEGADSYKVYTLVEDVEIKSETTIDPKYFVEGVEKGYRYAVSALFGDLESEKCYASLTVKGIGYFKGYVTDGTNALKGIQVKVSSEYGDASAVVTTDEEGYFNGEIMEGDNYILTISHSDYDEFISTPFPIVNQTEYDFETIELNAKPSSDVTSVTATVNGDNVDVEWTVEEATKYNVYRRLASAQDCGEMIAEEIEGTTYTDTQWTTVAPGTYQYGVAALVEPQAQTRGTKVIFEEGFENNGTNIPTGWTKSGSAGVLNSNGYYNSGIYGCYLGGTTTNSTLTSPEIDLTSYSSATWSFYYWSDSDLSVKIKVKDGEWNLIQTYPYRTTFEKIEIALSEDYVGKVIQIQFEHKTAWTYTCLDDILIVSESSETETQIVWSNGVVKQGPATFIGGDTENPTAWNVDANWSTGSVPADGADVTINANAVISSAVNVSNLTINNGDSYPYNKLTVANGGALTVTGLIKQESNYQLVLEEGGQIFQNNANVTARFTMSIDNPSDWSNTSNKDGWQFISMPMENVSHEDFTSYGEYDLYKYDGGQDLEWQNHKDGGFDYGGVPETTFRLGVGYLASLKDAETATVYGTLNKATSKTWGQYYVYDKDLANFQLIGNPFTFDMDMTKLNSYETMVAGYAVVNANGEYEYKTDGTVKVGEGFFVKVATNYAQLIYDHNAKSTRSSSNNSLNITATGNAGKDNVIINLAGKSEGFDKLQNFNDAIATVYVAEDGKNYGIYNCDADVQEIELSFNANQMGNYTISIEPNGKFQTVTLVDRFTGVETNMLVEDYNFTAMSSDNHNRFIVRFANGQESTDNSHFVYQSGEELILNIQGEVQIVDVLGRVVYNGEAMNDINRINVSSFNSGAYMVKVMNGNEVKVEKVVIY